MSDHHYIYKVAFNDSSTVSNSTTMLYNQYPAWTFDPAVQPKEGGAKAEDPLAWLRRRVEETLWFA